MARMRNIFNNIKGERIVSSYDFIDLVSGRAIQTYHLGQVYKGAAGTIANTISESVFWAIAPYYISGTLVNQATSTKIIDEDFDIEIDKQSVVGGSGLLSVSFGWTGVAGFSHEMFILAKIRHYDGSTETDITSSKSGVLTSSSASSRLDTLLFEIPKTTFAKDDTLRITIEVWAKNLDPGNTATYLVGADPEDRTVSGVSSTSSQLLARIPWKIDI